MHAGTADAARPAGSAPSRSAGPATNPIDLDLCTRCNACIAVCPEQAIGFGYQIDLAQLHGHRDCVSVCERRRRDRLRARASEPQRELRPGARPAREPAFALHQPPQGYFHAARRRGAARRGAAAARDASASSRSPSSSTTSRSSARTAATSRSAAPPASRSARRRRSAATLERAGRGSGGIVVEPHLCVGCGACTTVCPSGALSYAYAARRRQGARIRTLLATYAQRRRARRGAAAAQPGAPAPRVDRRARPRRAHRRTACTACRRACCRSTSGTPPSVGIDLWLAAIALRRVAGLGADDRRGGAATTARRSRADGASRRPS